MKNPDKTPLDDKLTIAAEVLYLLNLLLFPGIAFLILTALYLLKRRHGSALLLNHLAQTIGVSMIAGILMAILGLGIWVYGDLNSGYTWLCILTYFTTLHIALIFMGVIGLVKAMNQEHISYFLLGRMFRQ